MSLHPIRLALGVRFLREKKIGFFFSAGFPVRQPSKPATVGKSVSRGKCTQRNMCPWVGHRRCTGSRRGKYWSQCAARGSGQGYPPAPGIARHPWGRDGRCYPRSWSCQHHIKKSFFGDCATVANQYTGDCLLFIRMFGCLPAVSSWPRGEAWWEWPSQVPRPTLLLSQSENQTRNDPPFSCLEDLFAVVLNVHFVTSHMHGKCISDMQSSLIRQLGFSYR